MKSMPSYIVGPAIFVFLCLWPAVASPDDPRKEVGRDGTFIAYDNGVVYDEATGLEWMAGPDEDTNWNKAKSWVETLEADGGGWRMPNLEELQSLYKPKSTQYNRTPLLKCTGYRGWSGEAKDSSEAWYFEFMYSGEFKGGAHKKRRCSISFDYAKNMRAFAVRSRSQEKAYLPRTNEKL